MRRIFPLFIILLLGTTAVFAHGGGEIKIGRAPVGEYKLTVWLNPPQPQVGETIHITVGVLGQNDEAVLDAAVGVQVIDVDGNIVIDTAATTEQSVNKLFYETDFVLKTAVSHQIITTLHKDSTIGDVAFTIDIVESKLRLNYLWIGLAALLLIVPIGLWQNRRKS
jgi:hypothetical protein